MDEFNGKKVLVFGLGLLGGGVATTNWLLKHGAKVTVTDLKNKKQLMPSLKRVKGPAKLRRGASKVKLSLGGHLEKDIRENDIIVLNPDVSPENHLIKLARKLGKQIKNEATIFYKLCPRPIIAVTGTRGKTTTANWLAHLLNARYRTVVSGNSYIEPLLKTLDRVGKFSVVVNELPSYHLELFGDDIKAPEVVITNIFQDHLNRHGSLKKYARAKANIFKNQTANQNLVLNYDNKWTPFFLKLKPRAKIWFFSSSSLPKKIAGVFCKNGTIFFQTDGLAKKALDVKNFTDEWGEHNLQNLLAASLMAFLCGVPWAKIQRKIKTLPPIPFRQEIVFQNKKLKIINDTSATSPDGGIAAIKRFGGPHCVLIAGGTDPAPIFSADRQKRGRDWSGASRGLDFKEWAKVVRQKIKPGNLVLLAGSATEKMLKYLGKVDPVRGRSPRGGRSRAYGEAASNGVDESQFFDTLKECVTAGFKKALGHPKSVLLFSPAAKSFEKFKNEFDRGKQFNALIKKGVKKWIQR